MAQKSLLLIYNNQLHKCHLLDDEPRDITIGKEWTNHVTFPDLEQPLTVNWDGSVCKIEDNHVNGHWQQPVSGKPMDFFLVNDENRNIYDITGIQSISVGSDPYADITIDAFKADFVLLKQQDRTDAQIRQNSGSDRHPAHPAFTLDVQKGAVYHNSSPVSERAYLEAGDQLFTDGVIFIVGENEIQIMSANRNIESKLVSLIEVDHPYQGDYPDYHRSPRIIYREPEEKKEIAKPANKPSKPSEQLARTIVPPLVMIGALALITLVQPRGIYIIVMLAVTVTTIIFSITSYVKSVRKYKRDMKEREETYKAYLQRKTKELYETSEEQRHALNYHYPNVEEIRDMAVNVEARIYEKTMFHHDFLNFRTGLGKVESSFEIEFNEEEFTQEEDELLDEARELLNQRDEIENVPVVTSFMKGPVGYIGHRKLVLEQLQLLVMQLSLFHSYHDLQFITIFPEEEKEEWHWMR